MQRSVLNMAAYAPASCSRFAHQRATSRYAYCSPLQQRAHTERRRGSLVLRASSEQPEVVEFTANLLQDARQGQEGFETKLKVEKSASAGGAKKGDVVTLQYACSIRNPDGTDSPLEEAPDPITFEVGAGDFMGNALFQAFDEAVMGLSAGADATVEAQSGDYDKGLLFAVPRGHEEIARLEDVHSATGGLREGMMVNLANGQAAMVRQVDEAGVLLDCNHPLAGAPLTIKLKIISVEAAAAAA